MEIIRKIAEEMLNNGIDSYYVGGTVRDKLIGIPVDDIDICLTNVKDKKIVTSILKKYCDKIVSDAGSRFPVWIGIIGDVKIDYAMARKENLVGNTRKDFDVDVDSITIEQDLERRDLTINAIAQNILTGDFIDPFNGRYHILEKIAHPVGSAFAEDTLRVLRAARFIARFELTPSDDLIKVCKSLRPTDISNERVGMEVMKLFKVANKSSIFFYFLRQVDWLKYYFQELENCIDVPQDWNHHPEGSSLIQCSPYTTCITSPTETSWHYFSFGQLFSGSFTVGTTIEPFDRTTTAKSIVNATFDSFSGAFRAGSNSGKFSSVLTPATIAHPKTFVFSFGSSTFVADKIIRVVFKVPKSGMHGVMQSSINDFEIFNRIIQPISIFMMDMFGRKDFSTKMEHHNYPVETSRISDSWIHNVGISSIIVDSASMTSDGYVICSFDLGFNSKACFTHFKEFMYKDNSFSPDFQKEGDEFLHVFHAELRMGDVFTHTMYCLDQAQDWFTRAVMLCHDLGKAHTTTMKLSDRRIQSIGHEFVGIDLTKNMLKRIHFCSHEIINQIACLVELHMVRTSSTTKVVRKTLRRLMHYKIPYSKLVEVCRCDVSGRPPLPAFTPYIQQDIADKLIEDGEMIPIVTGEHLLELGLKGPDLGKVQKIALELQDRGTLRKDNWKTVLKGCSLEQLKGLL